jgi:phosphoglycolate phosphatase-like HAD superfamily hydrolase
MSRPIYIFDLDGTLANAEHRIHHINGTKKDWRAFFAAANEDAPITAAITTFKALVRAGAECWVWTGRSDEVRADTIIWLREHVSFDARSGLRGMFSAPERFLMRKAGDHRPDHELKAEWLSQVEPPEYARLTAVFEDRARVVQMWRNAGIPCFQVAPGDF